MNNIELGSSLKAWSLLDPKPVSCYSGKHDVHIVWWNGFRMTHKTALIIASKYLLRVGITPQMKTEAYAEFVNAYTSGAFSEKWILDTFSPSSHFNYLDRKLSKHISNNVVGKYTTADVLSWFIKERI